MRLLFLLLGLCIALFTTSCKVTSENLYFENLQTEEARLQLRRESEKREISNAIHSQLEQIRQHISQGKIDMAENELFLLQNVPGYENEITLLNTLITNERAKLGDSALGDLARQKMIAETQSRLFLPDSYGKTLVIDSNLEPLQIPAGPMEELINRKISVTMDHAGVKELVQILSNQGLNVVADDALESNKKLSLSVKDTPLKELFAYIARNMGIAFHLGENLIWITKGEVNGGAELETRIIRLRQGIIPQVPAGSKTPGAVLEELVAPKEEVDNDLEEALKLFFATSPKGSFFRIFKNRNLLVLYNTRENLRLAEKIVQEFDKPPYQVVIEAKFITVSQDDLRDLGAEWTKYSGGNSADPATPNPLSASNNDALQVSNFLTKLAVSPSAAEIGNGALTLSGVVGNRTFDLLISAIEKKNSALTLSSPRITVMNNRTARIRKGDKYFYFKQYNIATLNKGDAGEQQLLVPTGAPTELPVGITFDVKVNVGNDGKTVMLGMKPAIVEFKGWESYDTTTDVTKDKKTETNLTPVKLPRTHEQTVMTTVEVANGHTVIMGGMITNGTTQHVKKVPLFGDLPLIGFLFRRTESTSFPANLLIFVTATVIGNTGEYLNVQ